MSKGKRPVPAAKTNGNGKAKNTAKTGAEGSAPAVNDGDKKAEDQKDQDDATTTTTPAENDTAAKGEEKKEDAPKAEDFKVGQEVNVQVVPIGSVIRAKTQYKPFLIGDRKEGKTLHVGDVGQNSVWYSPKPQPVILLLVGGGQLPEKFEGHPEWDNLLAIAKTKLAAATAPAATTSGTGGKRGRKPAAAAQTELTPEEDVKRLNELLEGAKAKLAASKEEKKEEEATAGAQGEKEEAKK